MGVRVGGGAFDGVGGVVGRDAAVLGVPVIIFGLENLSLLQQHENDLTVGTAAAAELLELREDSCEGDRPGDG